MAILSYKVWEDAAANSAGAGGVAGIGVGASGEPGVHMGKKKKDKKKEKDVLFKVKRTNKAYGEDVKGGRAKSDWEKRAELQRNLRSKLWKDLGMKL